MKQTERNVRMFVPVASPDRNGMVHVGNNIYVPFETLKNEFILKFGMDHIAIKDGALILKVDFRLALNDGSKYMPPSLLPPDEFRE